MIISNKKQVLIFLAIFIFIISTILIYFFKVYNTNSDFIESENILENDIYNSSSDNIVENNIVSSTNNDDTIIVHVAGAIHNPGIVKLFANSRISDAIGLAGGFTEEADVSTVNLAYKLSDGEKIYIPYIDEKNNLKTPIISSNASSSVIEDTLNTSNKSKGTSLVNINSATQTELETIPGIGPSTALKIIDYRNRNGNFKDISDIKNVSRNWFCKI